MITRTLLSIALCGAGCAGDSHSTNNTPKPPAGSGASHTQGSKPPDRSSPMSGKFAAAYAAFRAHAAKQLDVDVDSVQGGPNSEPLAQMVEARVGSVWAFGMRKADDYTREVRGWATGDGTVVTLDQNLGVLLAEASVWGGGAWPELGRDQIADRLANNLTWSLGMNHKVFAAPHQGIVAPEITLNEDGSGTFTFVIDYRPPGPGKSPRQLTRIDIALTADHRATATRTRIPPPAP